MWFEADLANNVRVGGNPCWPPNSFGYLVIPLVARHRRASVRIRISSMDDSGWTNEDQLSPRKKEGCSVRITDLGSHATHRNLLTLIQNYF